MSNPAPTLMIQGCTSDAGKSTVVAGLCRLFAQRGLHVAPFKPQNMALNSAVTEEGGEIGRAQALQAVAAGIPASVHMNPVLLKPNSDTGAQVIVQGQSIGNLNAQNYHQLKPQMHSAVLDSYRRLGERYGAMLVEGAGSPAEVNLREGDIANMGFAEAVDCPVILVADIDKGGVFAHIVGTLACLSESEQARIKGFIINRFRGDIALLQDGLDWLEQKTGKPVLGVLPYLHGLHLDAEDAIHPARQSGDSAKLKVIAPLLPHISNHTDLDPLIQHPQVAFQWVKHNQTLPPADLIILPGSKNIHFDLNWLKQQGWPDKIQRHLRYGGKLIGICGGLQMLGRKIDDPHQIESEHTALAGLGILNISTVFETQKTLRQTEGTLLLPSSHKVSVTGYEIHHGITSYPTSYQPAIQLNDGRTDGIISEDNQILATYLHGLFDAPEALQALLNWAGLENAEPFSLDDHRNHQLDWLAQTLEEHCKIDAIQAIMGL